MLTVNFSTPLAGHARLERIKQLANNHPAFAKSRDMQALLVKIQTALRRMPGISAKEANEIIDELQEVGQTINQETSQLVDAVTNMILDQEEADKALARMNIESTLAKAKTEDQEQTISDIRGELTKEKERMSQEQSEMEKLMHDFDVLKSDYKNLQEAKGPPKDLSPDQLAKVKKLQEKVTHLEEQVQSRRSLWVMKHAEPEVVARAIETLVDSVQDNPKVRTILDALKSADAKPDQLPNGGQYHQAAALHSFNETPVRPPTAFQPMNRGAAGALSRFGQTQNMPPRAPSTAPFDRRMGSWTPSSSLRGPAPPSNGQYQSGAASYGAMVARNPWPPRGTSQMFGGAGSDFQQQQPSHARLPAYGPPRPPSSFSISRDSFPKTPTRNGRGKYSSFADMSSPSAGFARPMQPGGGGQNTMAATTASSLVGPIIRVSEQNVAAWNDRVMEFYAVIRNFVERHANTPDDKVTPEKMVGTDLWVVLTAMYHPLSEPEAASYLEHHLRSENSKCCLVTRVIIDYVVNRVWSLVGWHSEADDETNFALMQLEKHFEQSTAQPSITRQPLLDRQATLIESIMKRQDSAQFQKRKVDETAGTLLEFLQPLMNRFSVPADAYRDLEEVALLAWSLSSQILTSRLTFDFRFPEIGSRFSSQSMLPIWPPMEPLELQARHWRVALVTTPVITCRNDMGSNISAHSVALADVICMQ